MRELIAGGQLARDETDAGKGDLLRIGGGREHAAVATSFLEWDALDDPVENLQ